MLRSAGDFGSVIRTGGGSVKNPVQHIGRRIKRKFKPSTSPDNDGLVLFSEDPASFCGIRFGKGRTMIRLL